MAVKKIQMRPPDNNYADVLHPETDTTMVLLPDGSVLQNQLVAPLASGSATALVIDMPGITSYTHLKLFQFIASANNNGAASTLKVGTLAARPIYLEGTVSTAPKLIAGKLYTVWADNTKNCFFLKASGSGNAVAADLLAGKTATTDNGPIVGTMPNRGAVTNTITTQGGSYTIPAGYHNGSGKVTANFANLIASNIRAGVNIGGVVGNLVPKVSYPTSTAIDVFFNQLATHTILTLPSDWSYFTFVSDMSTNNLPESSLQGYNGGRSKLVFGNATLLSETGSYLNSSTSKIYSFTMYRVNSNSARVIGITYHSSSSNRIDYEGSMTITLANHSLTAQLSRSSSEGSAYLKLKGVYYVG